MSALLDNFKVKSQYVLPKKIVSRLVGRLASAEMGKWTTWLIKNFIKHYNVDMQDAEITDISKYKSFNDFFTRSLKKNARPINKDKSTLTHPADGTISEFGNIYKDAIIQAKGHYYSLEALLGGNHEDAKSYENGQFMTIYLSPKDYHRVHMPFDGKLKKMIFVPGELFSVNPLTARNVDNLFARNERVICFFENEKIGEFVVVMVGATIVASISMVFAGIVAPQGKDIKTYDYQKENVVIKKGAELGCFLLGSTVICVFPQNTLNFVENMTIGTSVKMGETFAKLKQ